MDLQTILTAVDAWPPEDRLRLIEAVWDRLTAEPEAVVLTDAQKQDLGRRLETCCENPRAGATWEEVRSRLQEQKRSHRWSGPRP